LAHCHVNIHYFKCRLSFARSEVTKVKKGRVKTFLACSTLKTRCIVLEISMTLFCLPLINVPKKRVHAKEGFPLVVVGGGGVVTEHINMDKKRILCFRCILVEVTTIFESLNCYTHPVGGKLSLGEFLTAEWEQSCGELAHRSNCTRF
jgi:hypothetical protein